MFSSVLVAEWPLSFWEIAAYSVDHVFLLCFEGLIWVLIASAPDPCILLISSEETHLPYMRMAAILVMWP